jgi:endonuclease/exonuclease/phosphatase family metal-dependent hydrolase
MTGLTSDQRDPRGGASTMRLMSFNIRFDAEGDARTGDRWADRAMSVIETVRRFAPDIVGFQEALRGQLDDLIAALPDHQAVGSPRESGSHGEYVPIFFDTRRFTEEESGDFWLSATPEVVGSIGWDASVPRHCTWLRIFEPASQLRYAVFNTHLDRWGPNARSEAARIIAARVSARAPSLVLGDFNADEASEPVRLLRQAGLRDTFREVHPDERDVQTVHHYARLSGIQKIDYIWCDRRWEVMDADIIREPAGGRLPSDHYPVVAELRASGAAPP